MHTLDSSIGVVLPEPFNECYASLLGTSSISVCDADTGAVGIDTYVDDQCLETVSEGAVVSGCTAIEGAVCTEPGVACATSTSCVTDGEYSQQRADKRSSSIDGQGSETIR